jgi:TolB-like protein/Flp pilus assembly protein TadD
MAVESKSELHLEIGHILFLDIVGYSKSLADEQKELIQELNRIVRETRHFQAAEAEGKLTRLPTGDGMVLVFTNNPEAPVECALEISQKLQSRPQLKLRMGIHSGPVNPVADVNDQANLAGAGINIAQRVMSCGDAGHILLSKHFAEDLEHYAHWRSHLHNVGEVQTKHGAKIQLVNLYTDQLGNAALPAKLKQARAAFRLKSAAIAALLLIAAFSVGFWMLRGSQEKLKNPAALIPYKSIAVLPFKPLVASIRDEVLEAGVADTLIAKLSTSRELIVPSLASARKYDDQRHDSVATGRALRVNSVLEGNLQKSGDRIRVTARLIKVADGTSMWSGTFDEKFTDVFRVEDTIAQKVAAALQLRLSEEDRQRLTKRYTDNTDAYQLYVKGRFYWNKFTEEGFRKSIEFFKQAADKDPNYALAYSGLADSYSLLGEMGVAPPKETFPQARAYAEKALKIDETLSEAHLSLGIVKLFYDWDVPFAEKELLRAKELDPHNVQVYHFNGHRLEFQSRFEEAVAEFKRGVDVDPTNLIINAELGNAYYLARQFDAAVAQCRKTLELDPNFELASVWLAQAYEQKGMYQEALVVLNKARPVAESCFIAEVGCSEAGLGHRAEAEKIIKELEERMTREYIDETLIVYIFIALGDKDQAFAWMEKAYQSRAGNLPWMIMEPKFDPLRSDPRFTEFVRRMGLK